MTNDMTTPSSADISPTYGFGRTLPLSYDAAIAHVTEALKAEGFGVLTAIDVQATMKAKLDLEYPPYAILGACNPPLAHRALTADPNVGLLLPCNVVVRALPDEAGESRTRVEAVDPISMMSVVANDELRSVAQDARARLERAIAAL